MRTVTLSGPDRVLTVPSGRRIEAGVPTEVTDEDAALLEAGPHNVTVSDPEPDDDES